jgi:glycosyltransferase involved in cell wall biosynthesis
MADKIKILMLNYEFPPLGAGAANATYYLLKEFSKDSSLEVDLVTSSVNKFRIEKFAPNITVHYLDINKKGNLHYQSNKDLLTYSFKAYKYSKDLMKKKKFDICHAFFGIPCGYIAMKLKIPYIVGLRGSDVPFYNKRFYWLDKLFFNRLSKKIWKKSKFTIANSTDLRSFALKASPKQKIGIIYNGVDIKEYKPLKNKKIHKPLRIISTSRLVKIKGHPYVLEAIGGKNYGITFVGDGTQKDELVQLAKKVNAKAIFVGKKDKKEVVNYLQNSDVFILNSEKEGMSNSLLEAMASGLAIIVTNTGGAQGLIKGNGFIIEKGSSASIREALDRYDKDPKLLKEHSLKSRKIAETLSWDNVAKQYKELYQK